MTTLTAHVPGRPDHCVHKLPASCRLTAKPICCACQDKRPHATLYQKYIDGVGFVLRGRRQERYCWQCKVFWDKRVDDSGIPQEETRIPETPDQTEFISKWFDWHRGFRSIRREDGSENRQAMVGEPLSGVDIGCLPRTVEDLRNGLLESSDQTRMNLRQRTEYQEAQGRATEEEESDGEGPWGGVVEEDRLFDTEPSSTPAITPAPARPRPRMQNFPTSVAIDSSEQAESLRSIFETTFSETFAPHLPEATRIDLFDTATNFPRFNATLERLSSQLLQNFLLDLNESTHTLDEDSATSMRLFVANNTTINSEDFQFDNSQWYPGLEASRNQSSIQQTPSSGTAARNGEIGEPRSSSRISPQSLNIAECQSTITQLERDLTRVRRRLGQLAPLGTQEDVQDPAYVSPVANMFNNYYSQHIQRQAARQAERQNESQSERQNRLQEEQRRLLDESETRRIWFEQQLEAIAGDQPWRTPSNPSFATGHTVPSPASVQHQMERTRQLREMGQARFEHRAPNIGPSPFQVPNSTTTTARNNHRQRSSSIPPRRSVAESIQLPRDVFSMRPSESTQVTSTSDQSLSSPSLGLDVAGDERPEALEDADMMILLRCAICFHQIATIALAPCGHLVMCKWCQQQAIPSHRHDATQPADRRAQCPVCRRGVKKMLRIYGPEQSTRRPIVTLPATSAPQTADATADAAPDAAADVGPDAATEFNPVTIVINPNGTVTSIAPEDDAPPADETGQPPVYIP